MEWVNKSYRIFLYYRLTVVLHRVSIDTMIVSFRDKETRRLWQSGKSRGLPADLQLRAFKKLAILNASVTFDNLKVPPGNQLEALRGKRRGKHRFRASVQ